MQIHASSSHRSLGDVGEGHLVAARTCGELDGEGVVAEEQLDHKEPPDEHHEVFSGTLLVANAGLLRLPAVGPVHVL
jgi:hypothetical protein